jgi:hypothetical protein
MSSQMQQPFVEERKMSNHGLKYNYFGQEEAEKGMFGHNSNSILGSTSMQSSMQNSNSLHNSISIQNGSFLKEEIDDKTSK